MAFNFSLEELAIIALLLDEEEQEIAEQCRKKAAEQKVLHRYEERQRKVSNNPKQIVLLRKKQQKLATKDKKVRKRIWVHPSLVNRKNEGEFFRIYSNLVDDEDKFIQYFRMSPKVFEMILAKIEGKIRKRHTNFREAISPREKLAVCLRFLTTGQTYSKIAKSYRLGLTTVRSIVMDVCNAINELSSEFIPTPQKEDWTQITNDIWTKWKFPNCLGFIDGRRIRFEIATNSKFSKLNCIRNFSVEFVALVDAHYKFVAVDVGLFRKRGSGIFGSTKFGKHLDNGKFNVPEDRALPGTDIEAPYVILGDESFPLKRYLMRPFARLQSADDVKKKVFNDRLYELRKLTENAFGILFQTFKIYYRKMKTDPQTATSIILTTCILHNILRNNEAGISYNPTEKVNTKNVQNFVCQGGNAQADAFSIRNVFKEYFNSPEGCLKQECNEI